MEPFEMEDFVISMGAGTGIAHGIKKVSNQRVVAFMGDSTFFHAGMPPLVNLVYNESNPIVVILDNSITAMTGHQPNPGSGFTSSGKKVEPIKIENIVASFGIKNLKVVNAYSQEQIQSAAKELAEKNELGVIISRGMCRLLMKRMLRAQGKEFAKYRIDQKKCIKCGICTDKFACPAIVKEGNKFWINEDICWGCSVCAQICPAKAISVVVKENQKGGMTGTKAKKLQK
jgi:indolepyruvate ferredoxin oxidoreductase alpha subunit